MIETVKNITSDPLSAVHEDEERMLIEGIKQGFHNNEEEDFVSDMSDEDEKEEKKKKDKEGVHLMETELLE